MARDLDIEGRSDMSKEDLLDAIEEATDENGRGKGSRIALRNLTKDEHHQKAQMADFDGRSSMSKEQLVEALYRQD